MLDMSTMASHGHQNLPFGYDHNEVQGLGLPPFLDQPPPHGRPLLSEQESSQMQYFFSNIADDQMQSHTLMNNQYHNNMTQLHPLQMPNTYVGHDTYMQAQPQQSMDWHNPQMGSYQYNVHHNNMSTLQSPTSPFSNGHGHGHILPQSSPIFPPPATQNVQSMGNSWQQPYQPHGQLAPQRTDMHFGTDPHFLHTGYAAPDGTMDADLSLISYAMQPTSSGSTTRPNSCPGSNTNTEPSSPVALKKRKLNAFQTDALRMTTVDNGVRQDRASPPIVNSSRKSRKPSVKKENVPTSSFAKSRPRDDEAIAADDDAEYDDDDSANQAPSPPAPWPASKARPAHKPAPPPKINKARKKSTSVAISRQTPSRRQSSSAAASIARVPLTAEQKKANHTNSEQRRRDATSKAYADLYDLVPEIEEGGKQSTMKKLHSVVAKVEAVSDRLRYLRELLGKDATPGGVNTNQSQQHHNNDMSQLGPWQ